MVYKTKLPKHIAKRCIKKSSCIEWGGCLTTAGYGQVMWEGKVTYLHRLSYSIHTREIEKGMTIDHLCKNKKCLNPAHLEQVTRGENARRASSRRHNTHCYNGHLYNKETTIISKTKSWRTCRICIRKHDANQRIKKGQIPRLQK